MFARRRLIRHFIGHGLQSLLAFYLHLAHQLQTMQPELNIAFLIRCYLLSCDQESNKEVFTAQLRGVCGVRSGIQ